MSRLAINGGSQSAAELSKVVWPVITKEDEEAVLDAMHKRYLGGLGDENLPARIFEREFAKYHDSAYGITVANGTLSLELSLKACGIRPGDKVLVPAITFIASATAIVSVGAVPVFVDVDPETCQISASSAESSILPGTRGIIVVHYSGYMADMDDIMAIAKKHDLIVIEDCAHAQGSAWRGKKAGSWGTFGSFSFQQSKAISSGEGGAVITSDEELYNRATLLMNIGRRPGQTSYEHTLSASNWRLGGLQGALLLSQFRKFPGEAAEREKNGARLAEEINKISGLRCLPKDKRMTNRGYYFMVVDFDEEAFGCSRDKFLDALDAEGATGTFCGYNRPIYKEPAFSKMNLSPLLHEKIDLPDYNSLFLPNAERWAAHQVTISHSYLLGNGRYTEILLEAIKKIKENVAELKD